MNNFDCVYIFVYSKNYFGCIFKDDKHKLNFFKNKLYHLILGNFHVSYFYYIGDYFLLNIVCVPSSIRLYIY